MKIHEIIDEVVEAEEIKNIMKDWNNAETTKEILDMISPKQTKTLMNQFIEIIKKRENNGR